MLKKILVKSLNFVPKVLQSGGVTVLYSPVAKRTMNMDLTTPWHATVYHGFTHGVPHEEENWVHGALNLDFATVLISPMAHSSPRDYIELSPILFNHQASEGYSNETL